MKNSFLLLLLCQLCFWTSGISQSGNAPTDYMAYYPFDGNANDQSSNAYHGSLVSGPTLVSGYNGGQAYNFNGSSYIELPLSARPTGAHTIAFWLKPDTNFGTAKSHILGGRSFGASYARGGIAFSYFGPNGKVYYDTYTINTRKTVSTPATDFSANTWTHVAISMDAPGSNSTMKLYINGSLILSSPGVSATVDWHSNNFSFKIGKTYDDPGFDGTIDEVYVYERALSDTEISQIYNGNSGGNDSTPPSTPTNLIASSTTTSSTQLSWSPSTDNVGVSEYEIYQNGTLLGVSPNTNYSVSGLNASTTYSFYVRAKDAAGNFSNNSNTISVTTSSPGGCANTISSFPHNEGFENTPSWEPYTDVYSANCTSGDNTFIRENDPTSSGSTGPTTAQEGSHYVYTESSSGCYNANYIINSPCYDLSGQSSASIDFYYHMWGSSTGTLSLEITTNGGSSWSSLWQLSGDQGNAWQLASVNLDAYVGQTIQLRFSGLTSSSYTGDMAIDNIMVDASSGSSGQADLITQSISAPGSATEGSSISVSCQVSNQGNAAAGSSTLYYYFSSDDTFDGSDTYLAQDAVSSLNAGNNSAESASITLPTGLSAGVYYILFRADALDNIAESNENNNVGSKAITITTSGGTGGSNQWVGPDDSTSPIYRLGEVSIGTANLPAGYTLAVDGSILAEEVKVQLSTQWPDYVFSHDYDLLELEELKKYIRTHRHLPNIPSAAEVKASGGHKMGALQVQLLRKIEEMSLYQIQLLEQLKEQGEELKTLREELDQLKQNRKK